jgi:hypothetical protein
MRIRLALGIALGFAATGCIVEAPSGGSAPQPPTRSQQVTPTPVSAASVQPRTGGATPIVQKIGALIGDDQGAKVEMAAVTVQPGVMVPGEAVKVSVVFNVLQDIKDDYMVFVHVEDVDGRVERMNLDHRPNNGKTPTTEWKKGQTISDDFYLMLPPGVPLRGLQLYAGLWEPTRDQRLKIKNPDKAPNDGNDRVKLVTIPVAQ